MTTAAMCAAQGLYLEQQLARVADAQRYTVHVAVLTPLVLLLPYRYLVPLTFQPHPCRHFGLNHPRAASTPTRSTTRERRCPKTPTQLTPRIHHKLRALFRRDSRAVLRSVLACAQRRRHTEHRRAAPCASRPYPVASRQTNIPGTIKRSTRAERRWRGQRYNKQRGILMESDSLLSS